MIKSRRRRRRRRVNTTTFSLIRRITAAAVCAACYSSNLAVTAGAISFLQSSSSAGVGATGGYYGRGTSSSTGDSSTLYGRSRNQRGQHAPLHQQHQPFQPATTTTTTTTSSSGTNSGAVNSSSSRILGILPPFPRFSFWGRSSNGSKTNKVNNSAASHTSTCTQKAPSFSIFPNNNNTNHSLLSPPPTTLNSKVLVVSPTTITSPLAAAHEQPSSTRTRRRMTTAVSFFTPPSTALFQTASSVANTTTTTTTTISSSLSNDTCLEGEEDSILIRNTATEMSSQTTPSVHLRLNEGPPTVIVADGKSDQKNLLHVVVDDQEELDNNNKENDPQQQQQQQQQHSSSSSNVVKVHSYTDPATQKTWKALNTAKSKFLAFLQYNNITSATMSKIVTQETNILVDPTRQQQREEEEEEQQQQQAAASAIQPPLSFMGRTLPSAVTAAAVAAASKTTTMNDNPDDHAAADSTTASALRKEWRSLWKRRQLLTDRTEFLAVYPSDTASSSQNNSDQQKKKTNRKNQPRRGGFVDLLHLYTERMAAILLDEREDAELHNNEQGRRQDNYTTTITTVAAAGGSTTTITERSLVSWLVENLGQEATHRLQARQLHQHPVDKQLQYWKEFLEWFRSQFPYYYDRCIHCGASIKEDTANNQHAQSSSSSSEDSSSSSSSDDCTHIHHEDDEEDGQGYQTFVGYVYPDVDELEGKASRTELYRCHKCRQFTRFPRFNSVWHVINERRGRCGEYSMLLFRFLRALGHECRWVVDWADHVWAEVFVPAAADSSSTRSTNMGIASLTAVSPFTRPATTTAGRWIHLDPCEAAVDENLIYQGWGKKQTYILGFYAPPKSDNSVSSQMTHAGTDSSWTLPFPMTRTATTNTIAAAPLIQDITFDYTSETWSEINKRRDESEQEVRNAIQKSIISMRRKIQSIMAPPPPPPLQAQSSSNISNNWMTTGLASLPATRSTTESTTTKQEDT